MGFSDIFKKVGDFLNPFDSLISGGAEVAGSLIGSHSSAKAQRDANEANKEMAREQMAFQERMSSTAFQRARKDAEAAGFNPLLATGHPASSPIGASATSINPSPNKGELMLSTAKTVADTLLTREMVKTERSKQELNRAETDRIEGGEINTPFGRVPIRTLQRNIPNVSRAGFTGFGQSLVSTAKSVSRWNKKHTRN